MRVLSVIVILAILFLALLAYGGAQLSRNAFGAVMPVRPDTSIATRMPTDANPQAGTCIEATTIARFMVKPDGEFQKLGAFTVYRSCK